MPLSCFAQLDNELFAVGGWDSSLHVFNMNYGSSVQVLEAHDDAVSIIVYLQEKVSSSNIEVNEAENADYSILGLHNPILEKGG